MPHKRILIATLTVLITLTGFTTAESGFRKYAGEFMAIDVSARAQAMGGAYSAMANDVYASFYNPAGLTGVRATQLAFTHTQQFISSVNYDFLGFARPISDNKVIGFSLIRLGVDNIQDSRAAAIFGSDGELAGIDLSQVEEFNSADYVFFVSLGTRLSERFSWGLNAKLVRRNLSDHSANGLGFDAGLTYALNDRVRLSGMFRNITSTLIAWDTGEKELVSPTLRFGTSYFLDLPGLNSYLVPNVDLIMETQGATGLEGGGSTLAGALGGELVIRETLSLRGGYDDLQRLNFGVGIQIPKISVDYSYTSFNEELGNAHRIGLMVDFGR